MSDLIGSSALKVQLGDVAYAQQIAAPHNSNFRRLLGQFAGAEENNYTGDGFLATFTRVAEWARPSFKTGFMGRIVRH